MTAKKPRKKRIPVCALGAPNCTANGAPMCCSNECGLPGTHVEVDGSAFHCHRHAHDGDIPIGAAIDKWQTAEQKARDSWAAYVGCDGMLKASQERERVIQDHRERACEREREARAETEKLRGELVELKALQERADAISEATRLELVDQLATIAEKTAREQQKSDAANRHQHPDFWPLVTQMHSWRSLVTDAPSKPNRKAVCTLGLLGWRHLAWPRIDPDDSINEQHQQHVAREITAWPGCGGHHE